MIQYLEGSNMSDLHIEIDNRRAKEKVVTNSCLNCGNYQTCTVRTTMPLKMYSMDTEQPYAPSDQFVSPMACGGSLWRELDSKDVPHLEKLPDETWKTFYARREAARSHPPLTE